MISTKTSTTNWVLVATILASSMAFIDSNALNVVMPTLQQDLDASGAALLWIVNAYTLPLAALILVGGALGDRFGRKRVFMIGIVVFVLASFVCGVAPSVGILIGGRVVQGMGGAMMIPGSLALLSASYPDDERGRAIGTWSAFTTLTTILGPVLGGWLGNLGLWRAVFFINIPLAVVSLYALNVGVPESRDEEAPKRIDLLGGFLATCGMALLSFGLIQAGEGRTAAWVVMATLATSAFVLLTFVWYEIHVAHPMINLSLFKSRTFSGTNVMTLFLYGALSGALFFLPLNLVQVQGYSQDQAGYAILPFAVLLTLLSRWSGGLMDRHGARLLLIVGPVIVGFGFLLYSFIDLTDGFQDYWTTFFPGAVVLGIGMGLTVAPLTTTVMGVVPSSKSGVASGINNAVSRSAGVLAVAVMGAIALLSFTTNLEHNTADVDMSPTERQILLEEATKLANADPPSTLEPGDRKTVERDIKLAFVDTFQTISLIGAGMCWISALLAAVTVET